MNRNKMNEVKTFNVELTELEMNFILMGLRKAILEEDGSVDVVLRLSDLFKRLEGIKDSEEIENNFDNDCENNSPNNGVDDDFLFLISDFNNTVSDNLKEYNKSHRYFWRMDDFM